MQPLIITAALVGAELSREQQPHLPLTPQEMIQSGTRAVKAGASILHLHVRDEKGLPTCDLKIIRTVVEGLKSTGAILQISTGGAVGDSQEERIGVLEAGPEMASLSTGSVNFGDDVFLNPRPFVERLAKAMLQKKIKAEIEVFDVAMLEEGIRLVQIGLIGSPAHFQFVLGVPGGLAASERNLNFLISGLPKDSTWSLAAIGRHQFPMVEFAIQKGGNVRVGFEDNIYLEKGVLAKSNAELVAKGVDLAEKHQRKVATIQEAREILGL